jgi:hypothetical protein
MNEKHDFSYASAARSQIIVVTQQIISTTDMGSCAANFDLCGG